METTHKFEPLIPGYTGHIPADYFEKRLPPAEPIKGGHVPGYAGYVNKIKPDNHYGKSFGKITTEINTGQEPIGDRFLTTNQLNFVDQNKIRCKKASEILNVDVPKKQYIQPTEEELKELAETVQKVQDGEVENAVCDGTVDISEVSKLVQNVEFIQTSLPGYTGHNRKVYAANIYGMSYKRAQEAAKNKLEEDKQEVQGKIDAQCAQVPPLFVSRRC